MKELNKMSTRISKANPWKFFALALGISWFFWIWVILLGWNVFTFPAIILGALGLFGPAIAEIILISRTHDKEQWRDYWQRVFDIRRISKSRNSNLLRATAEKGTILRILESLIK